LALLNYHEANGQFPLGSYTAVQEDHPAEEDGLGWATQILPQLEEEAIYEQLRDNRIPGYQGKPWITDHPKGQRGMLRLAHDHGLRPIAGGESVLSVFVCPSVDLPTHMPNGSYFGLSAADKEGTGYATAHYKASRGHCDRGMFWPPKEGAAEYDCSYDINGDGTIDFVPKRAYTNVSISDVTDGTSKTIMIGEAAYFARWQAYPLWIGVYGDDGSVMFETQDAINCNIGGTKVFPLSQAELDRMTDPEPDDCTFSWHSGGAYFAFVDGSVRFLNEDLEIRTFYLLGDRMDDEVISELQ
jgi:prepilin-type processing-associated H-X9-DG protein